MQARGMVRPRPAELQESRREGPVFPRPVRLLYSEIDERSSHSFLQYWKVRKKYGRIR